MVFQLSPWSMRPGGCGLWFTWSTLRSYAFFVATYEHVVAFFPLEPATLGHTLVVPRQHVPDIWSLDEDTAAQLARVTVRLSNVMRRALQPEGLNVIQSNGEVATQTVFHLHVHVVPRWEGDARTR